MVLMVLVIFNSLSGSLGQCIMGLTVLVILYSLSGSLGLCIMGLTVLGVEPLNLYPPPLPRRAPSLVVTLNFLSSKIKVKLKNLLFAPSIYPSSPI